MRFVKVSPQSKLLDGIKQLGRANSATLGFMPNGAFDDFAARGRAIAATDDNNKLLGYLLYRITGMKVTLVHLCVDEYQRNRGVARALFNHLLEHTKDYSELLIHSRRDFPMSPLWSRLGLKAIGERPGRGRPPEILTIWWHRLASHTLFDVSAESPKVRVAIDQNVFYDLIEERPHSAEAYALLSDWMSAEISVAVTVELFSEIDRADDTKRRRLYQILRITPQNS